MDRESVVKWLKLAGYASTAATVLGLAFTFRAWFLAQWAQVDPLIIMSSVLKLFWAVVGIAAIFIILRIVDWFDGIGSWREYLQNGKHDPEFGHYLRYRAALALGLCILLGLALH